MSDDEEYEYSSDDGGYSDDGADEDADEGAILIANTFYEADDDKATNPAKAIEGFATVVRLEQERGEEVKLRFKALENLVVLHVQMGNPDSALSGYRDLLTLISAVTSNETLDAINAVLDAVTTAGESSDGSVDLNALTQMYEVTLQALDGARNERLWFNTSVKLAKMFMATGQHEKLKAIISELHLKCKRPDGTDDPSKGTYLMEMYALDIQLSNATGDTSRMADIYDKVKQLSAAINDPRIMGVIHENFGEMHMARNDWNAAYQEYFDSFRSYSEAGNSRARTCLKYVVLANMLANESINPLDSQEAKVFKEDPEVIAMWRLRNAYTEKNFTDFHKVLLNPSHRINTDPFIMKYLQALIDSFRSVVVLNVLKPYRYVSLAFLAREVKATVEEVESLLVTHILDGTIVGSIDQVKGFLHVHAGSKASAQSYSAVSRWSAALRDLNSSLQMRLQ